MPQNGGTRWSLGIATILIACVVSVAFVEAGMRLVGITFPVFDVYDEVQGVKLSPGRSGWYRKEGEAFLEINSLGYRDREHDLAPPPDTFRIAVLGDSFTEARQMPVEETYWHRLGEELSSCPALDGKDVEVLNFGIGGYSTTQSLLAYEKDARRFQPDLVLLGFFSGNDIRENSRALSAGKADWRTQRPFHDLDDGELTLTPAGPLPVWKQAVYAGVQHSRVLELVNEGRRHWSVWKKGRDRQERDGAVEAGIETAVYRPLEGADVDPNLVEAWDLTARLLAEIDRKAEADGAAFMVATIPTSIQTHPEAGNRDELVKELGVDDLLFPDRQLAAFGEQGGYPVFPLVEDMQAAAGDRHFHGFANTAFGFGHMNAVGHGVMADLLAPKVCDELAGSTNTQSAGKSASVER